MDTDAPNRAGLPETPHELPFDRTRVDALLTRVQQGERVNLLEETLGIVDWSSFGGEAGEPLSPLERAELQTYYRQKWADIGPLYLADLLSTEFITEQRARGDIGFSPELLELGQTRPALWSEIRQFFRRKEAAAGLLLLAHVACAESTEDPHPVRNPGS